MRIRKLLHLLIAAPLLTACSTAPATNDNSNDNGTVNDNVVVNDNTNATDCPVGEDPQCDITGFDLTGDTAAECTLIILNCRTCCGLSSACVEACYRPNGAQSDIYCDCDGSGECAGLADFLSCPAQ